MRFAPCRFRQGASLALSGQRSAFISTDGHNIIRCGLVDEVVQPIGEEQVRVAPPADHGRLGVIVARIVVSGYMDGQSLVLVPQIFLFQSIRVVFRVTGHKNLTPMLGHNGIDTCLFRGGQNAQLRMCFNVLPENRCVPGMGSVENVVKASQQDGALVVRRMGEDSKELSGQLVLWNAVMVVKPRLGAPADMEGGVDVGFAPFHDPAQLGPVVHFFKGQLLHRGAGNDHSVKFSFLDFVKGFVKGQQMVGGSVFCRMGGGVHQLQMHLQGRIAQKAAELGFRDDLCGHQVQQQNFQRPDILRDGSRLGHHEDILLLQNTGGGQIIGYLNGHWIPPGYYSVYQKDTCRP